MDGNESVRTSPDVKKQIMKLTQKSPCTEKKESKVKVRNPLAGHMTTIAPMNCIPSMGSAASVRDTPLPHFIEFVSPSADDTESSLMNVA